MISKRLSLVGFSLAMTMSSLANAAVDKEWAFCNSKLAYHDLHSIDRKPQTDWLCELSTPRETGDSEAANSFRCSNRKVAECELDAGGNPDREPWGDFNVPKHAWFHIPGVSASHPHVRCTC